MKIASWRNAALVLGVICCYQRWHSCRHSSPTAVQNPGSNATDGDSDSTHSWAHDLSSSSSSGTPAPSLPDPRGKGGKSFYGFRVPSWAMHLLPQPGEKPREYRDRIVPLAQMAIAPHRARVARMRDDFGLDAHQRAELDAAAGEAAKAIEDRVMNAVLSGELKPSSLKPMGGIGLARDVLDIVDHGNTRFVESLSPDQRTKLATHRFDFADYLMFNTRWEDALKILDHAP